MSERRAKQHLFHRLIASRNGAVAIIFALTLIPLSLAGGLSVDFGRAYIVKNRLAYALDAAALAVAQSPAGTSEQNLNNLAQSFFAANYPSDEIGTPATQVSVTENDGVFTVSANAEVDTLLLKVVGKNTITVAAVSEVTREVTGLEVVMALDNTGSMAGARLTALKAASNTLVDILFGDETQSETLFMGIVPFAAMVNIGEANTSLLTTLNQQLYEPVRWSACVKARSEGRDQTDDPPDTQRWVPWLAPKTNGQFSFNFFPPVFDRTRGQFRGPNFECPVPLLPLTNIRSDITSKIREMVANGFTHINLGAVWAWRLISPGPPFTEGTQFNDENFNKAVIIMTDGSNVQGDRFGSAYDGNVSAGQLNFRLRTVCERMRDLGIRVYTIAFGNLSTSTRTLMRDCAGVDTRFFQSPNAADLQEAFQSIGTELSKLRVSR